MTDINNIWNAERESYRIQFADELLSIVKEMVEEYNIVSTHPEKQSILDIHFYKELEKRFNNPVK